MFKITIKISFLVLCLSFLALPFKTRAASFSAKDTYPKLANYFLKWEIPDNKVNDLAKWDLLILDMEVQHNSYSNLQKIRQINPDITILSYVTSQEIKLDSDSYWGELRVKLLNNIEDGWWLRSRGGDKVSFWPGTNMLNLADTSGARSWQTVLPEFMANNVISTGLWDGVFYDNLWFDVAWINDGDLDLNRDGSILGRSQMNQKWQAGNKELLANTQALIGDRYFVTANSQKFAAYQSYLNGFMLESFPSQWDNGGTWAGSMDAYTDNTSFKDPLLMTINANTENTWSQHNYRKMRFSLGSALLGDGYFSFDYGDQDHGQTWWYDEYDVNLGKALSKPYNLLRKGDAAWREGIWRRDFENGAVIVNSTKQNQAYVFSDEVFEKINGSQDRSVNNGAKINMVAMMGEDAVVLQNTLDFKPLVDSARGQTNINTSASDIIKHKGFTNGAFVRVFNNSGVQTKNGFFTYKEDYPGSSQVLITDIDGDGVEEELVNYRGIITIYKNGQVVSRFQPYDGKFAGEISFAVADLDGDNVSEIVTGTGAGGGPHVRIFNQQGRPLIGGFFAYDEGFRGGVNIAVIDLNGDGVKEIITGAGTGGGPHIRVFSKDGVPLSGGFFAFNDNTRGGVRIAVGNVDGVGEKEIIAGAGPGEPPLVRIFTKDGVLKKEFNAYDNDVRDGIMVIAADINRDGVDEILAGSLNY